MTSKANLGAAFRCKSRGSAGLGGFLIPPAVPLCATSTLTPRHTHTHTHTSFLPGAGLLLWAAPLSPQTRDVHTDRRKGAAVHGSHVPSFL